MSERGNLPVPPNPLPWSANADRRLRRQHVVLYSAEGCHLCERARATLATVRADYDFELEEVDIGGDPDLERRYRELLPVVEIDGRRAFVFHVPLDGLRRTLNAQASS